MTLRAYGSYDHSITDLEFLRFFPTLRRFGADALWDSLTSLDGLRHLPADLEELGIGATKVKLDLAVLSRFPELRWLFLEGQTKHLEVISGLTPAVRPHAALDHDARPVAASAADGPAVAGPQARRHARPRPAAAGRRALVPRALDDPRTDGRIGCRRDPRRSVRSSSRRCVRSRRFRT